MSASLFKYRNAFYLSQRFFDHLKISDFPVDVMEVFKKAGPEPIFVEPLGKYNASNPHPLKIEDAKCFYAPGKAYLIIYNEEKIASRIRFSLAHELGHIVLGHLDNECTELERGGLDDITYCILEGAANTFAGNFLAPPILIHEKLSGGAFETDKISSFFGLSPTAVRDYRHRDYSDWLTMKRDPCERSILKRCSSKLFPKYCGFCGTLTYGKDVRYCPICGDEEIFPYNGEVVFMKQYPGVPIDENKKVLECPRCGNTEIVSDGDYCPICGTYLFNFCVDTQKIQEGYDYTEKACEKGRRLPSNYRFCPYCGNETYFYQEDLLPSWNASEKSIKTVSLSKETPLFGEAFF